MTIGPIMLDVDGIELSPQDIEILQHPVVGGVILFARNYENIEQLSSLIKSIRSVREKDLLISVDHEGGRVQRFKDGFTLIPAMAKIGALYDQDAQAAKTLATNTAWLMASELRCMDIDFSFAPVADIDYAQCAVIGDRAFHADPQTVYELNLAFCQGLEQAGMASVAKHFPGHGAVSEDSHVEIPIDDREFDLLNENDIYPFRHLIQNNLSAVMPAHVIFSQMDASPAGFSRYWLQTILREQLNFNGVICSDDLNMQGASVAGEHYSDRAHAALNAGCDMILVCNNRPAAIEVIDELQGYDDPVSASRLAAMRGHGRIDWPTLQQSERWQNTRRQLNNIDKPK